MSEEEIRSLVDDEVLFDPQLEEALQMTHSKVSAMLQHKDEFPTVEQLDWVDIRDDSVVAIRDALDEALADRRHGLAVFAGRAGKEALVSELRRQVSWCEARRAEADALAADKRRLRDGHLRAMAGTVEEEDGPLLLMTAAEAFLEFLAKEMDGDHAPEADAIDAAARAGNGVGARFVVTFVRLAEMLRRRAEAYAGEEAAVAEGLRQRAAEVETLCADPEALVQRMLETESWRFFRILNRHAGRITPTQSSLPAAPKPTPQHPL